MLHSYLHLPPYAFQQRIFRRLTGHNIKRPFQIHTGLSLLRYKKKTQIQFHYDILFNSRVQTHGISISGHWFEREACCLAFDLMYLSALSARNFHT